MTRRQDELRRLLERQKALACVHRYPWPVRDEDGKMIAIITVQYARAREEEDGDGEQQWRPIAYVHLTDVGRSRLGSPWSPAV